MAAGGRVGYVAEAAVYHHHQESWAQVKRRFEREAIALQKIMPQIQVGWFDTARYIISSIRHDVRQARADKGRNGGLKGRLEEIVRYRVAQYTGSYRGNHELRRLSNAEKDHYFYPSDPLERL